MKKTSVKLFVRKGSYKGLNQDHDHSVLDNNDLVKNEFGEKFEN